MKDNTESGTQLDQETILIMMADFLYLNNCHEAGQCAYADTRVSQSVGALHKRNSKTSASALLDQAQHSVMMTPVGFEPVWDDTCCKGIGAGETSPEMKRDTHRGQPAIESSLTLPLQKALKGITLQSRPNKAAVQIRARPRGSDAVS